jgi:DNA polymerase-3 subunit gamma/tau
MGQALYRKYRSKSLAEVVGQEHITKTLANAIKSGKISHAYLFTGPRGVGKTSVARILAHEVNRLEYTDESIHLDIIEIDAASNRRIDEIRDLRDKVRIAPAAAAFKIYIIDEVHMLTREAFNALLKTLEEPPAHCIFILATTEAHKLPETIVSRTQRFEFKPIAKSQAAGHLAAIAKAEKIDIDKEALELLAEFGGGSFRDSISYLDQLSSYGGRISLDDVRQLLGLPAATEISQLLAELDNHNPPAILARLSEIEQKGVTPQAVAASLSTQLRQIATEKVLAGTQLKLLGRLLEVSASHRPKEALEIALLSLASPQNPSELPLAKAKTTQPKPIAEPSQTPAKAAGQTLKKPSAATDFSLDMWDELIDRAKRQAASIYTALRLATPNLEAGTLTLSFQFPLHQKKLELVKNKQLLSQIISEICGDSVSIKTELVQNSAVQEILEAEKPAHLGAISNIFGGAEVLEA